MEVRLPVPIARVEALVVSVPALGNAFAEGEEETLLVRVTDEDGTYGIGESVCTPQVIKAMVDQETIHFWSQGIADVLVGADPIEARALFDRDYHGCFYHGRRGTFIQAMSAVDIALWDLAGRQRRAPSPSQSSERRRECHRLRTSTTRSTTPSPVSMCSTA